MNYNESRRNFIKKAGITGIAALTVPKLFSNEQYTLQQEEEKSGITVLFQGDSITDGNRSRDNDWNHVLGHGYAYLIASKLGFDYIDQGFHFYNRGISGNKVTDLTERWQTDCLDIKPDVLSILVGINDIDQAFWNNKELEFTKFVADYQSLIDLTRKELPEVMLVICEPFILQVGRIKENWKFYNSQIRIMQAELKKMAKKNKAIYIDLQDAFNDACEKAPAEYWIWDGIHPMPAGHELIAREWIKNVK